VSAPLESPPVEGVTSSSKTRPIVEEEAALQNTYSLRRNKNTAMGPIGT
jgi:hypothetical protein